MKKYRVAAILMMIHSFMELGGVFALIPVLLTNTESFDFSRYFSFIVPYLQENLSLMLIMGAIYGVVRLTGAIGLLRNQMWGLVLSIINCVITMALMIFMLPAGVMDGILAGAALILMLTQYYGKQRIVEEN